MQRCKPKSVNLQKIVFYISLYVLFLNFLWHNLFFAIFFYMPNCFVATFLTRLKKAKYNIY